MPVRHRSSLSRKLCPTSESPGSPVRARVASRSAPLHQPAAVGPPPPGVSAAFLVGFLAQHRPGPEAPPEAPTTRGAAAALQRRRQEEGAAGAYVDSLAGETHFVTGGKLVGRAEIHVAHAWDASFAELVGCVATDAGGEMDRTYFLDLFALDLRAPAEDPVADAQRAVAVAREVLLVLDAEALALGRLWVLFEALLALAAGKLRVGSSAPGGFGATEAALRAWEARIDRADWVLSEATRKTDERRLRAFAQRTWESGGKSLEQRLAQLKRFLRREVYGQILLGAAKAGDKRAVQAALDGGASPEQCDALGNTAQEVAAFYGHTSVEELLFERRMQAFPHRRLSAFFRPSDLLAASELVPPDVLAPFLTEAVDEEEYQYDELRGAAPFCPSSELLEARRVMGHSMSDLHRDLLFRGGSPALSRSGSSDA